MRAVVEQLGGRRFIMAMGAGMSCTVLVWFGKITPEVFQWTVLGTVAAYIGGNTTQKVKAPTEPSPTQ